VRRLIQTEGQISKQTGNRQADNFHPQRNFSIDRLALQPPSKVIQQIDNKQLFWPWSMILEIVKFAKCLDFCVKPMTDR
jgi:hypothetical protein